SGVIDGPADLVVDVTQVSFVEPTAPPTALADPTFYLTLNGASYRPGDRAHAYLFSGDWVTDLGRPSLDTVIARGVSAGDEVCLIEADQSLVGCTTVTPPLQELALFTAENWQPQVLLTPASTSITVSVSNLPPSLSLSTRLYPVGAAAGPAVDLSWNGSVYQASIPTTQAAVAGTVRVWVNEAAPQRVTVANFSLGGNPARQHIGSNVLMRGRFAPAVSADGQVILFGDIQFTGDQFYAIQTAAAVPQAPSYATLVGESYYLLTSVDAPSLAGTTLSISYMARDVPDGEEIWLKMYYWNGSQWILLPSELDTDENMVTAPCQGQGLYALMSSVEIPLEAGWNLFSYPIPVSRTVTETLSSIAGSYSVVYNYNAATADWTVYGVDAPDWVNDLELFQFSKGYYINTTQATTLYLKGGFGPQGQNAPTLGVPYPPATYYGQVLSSAYFTPSAGQTVTVRIGEQVCGQGLTQNVGGQIVYVVNVAAAVQTAGCGVPGAGISFQVGAQAMAQAPLWNNNNLWELNLSPNAAPNPTPDTASTPEETTANLTVLANDTDPDGDSLSLQSVTSPAHGIAVINGTTVQYTPQLNYNGADTFYYTAVDVYGQTATALVSVQVTPVNDLPTAVDDTASVTEDVPSNIPVLNNDDDIDGDSISIHSVGAPLHGSATISGSVIQYTPASGYSGPDVFTYTIADPSGLMDTASVTVQVVEGVNAGPLAVADVALTLEDNAVTIPSLANDSDPNGDALTITGVEPPLHGTAVISGSGSLAVIIYTPELNFNGLDAFMYTISDGLLSANAMVRVTVQPVNDPPQAEAGADLTAVEGQELSFSGSYVDPDETSGAIISWDFGDGGSDESTLSPTHTYANEGVYTVTLTVTDTAGASASDSLQVTVANV
ncbi:MAG TPA: Ig-like domain-containing protein, partial [Anaerolineaceae bacterium]|nr:Ig-like domain-containing protein [Anaerolineaceae bacterium]